MSLLERARAARVRAPRGGDVTDEEVELALAFLRCEVSSRQTATALGRKGGAGIYVWAVGVLRKASAMGMVKVEAVAK